jgi:hypothetical protein
MAHWTLVSSSFQQKHKNMVISVGYQYPAAEQNESSIRGSIRDLEPKPAYRASMTRDTPLLA